MTDRVETQTSEEELYDMFAKKSKRPSKVGSNDTNPYLLASQGIQVRLKCYGYTSSYISYPFQHTVQFQEARIREYAQRNNHDFIEIYCDNNIRAEDFTDDVELMSLIEVLEPQLMSLIEVLKPHDIVVINNLSRLAPDIDKIIEIKDLFVINNIKLVSLDQNIDLETASGKLAFNIMAANAQYEYDVYRETQERNLPNN